MCEYFTIDPNNSLSYFSVNFRDYLGDPNFSDSNLSNRSGNSLGKARPYTDLPDEWFTESQHSKDDSKGGGLSSQLGSIELDDACFNESMSEMSGSDDGMMKKKPRRKKKKNPAEPKTPRKSPKKRSSKNKLSSAEAAQKAIDADLLLLVDEEEVNELFDAINLNPFEGHVIKPKIAKLILPLMKEKPELCAEKYTFDAFPEAPIYPLHMLCALGAPVACIKRCTKAYPEAFLDGSSVYGTPMHFACMFHHKVIQDKETKEFNNDTLAIMELLVKLNANQLKVRNQKYQQTPLHLACLAHHPYIEDEEEDAEVEKEVVSFITNISTRLATIVDLERNTPLHTACSRDIPSPAIVKHLVTVVPQACISLNKHGATPLHLAAYSQAGTAIMKVLLKTNCTPLRVLDQKGHIPLHAAIAVKTESIKVFKMLLKVYPDSTEVKTKEGERPSKFAKRMGLDEDIVELLQRQPTSV